MTPRARSPDIAAPTRRMLKLPHTIAPTWPVEIAAGRFARSIRRETPEGCALALLGLPDDTGVKMNSGRPGAARGPTAFRDALARYGAAEPGNATLPRVFDAGDVVVTPGSLEETHSRVTTVVSALLDLGLFPVAIGGGHDLTLPFVRAVSARNPGLAGLYFDAHLDVRESPGSGMAFRRLVEDCGVTGLQLHGYRPLVNSREHLNWFRAHGGKIMPDDAPVRLPKPSAPARPNGKRTSPRRSAAGFFVSFDLDVIDAAQAPGVSAANPMGWSVERAAAWMQACGASPQVRCLDLMELNPVHDDQGRTARIAAHLFLSFLAGFAQR